MKITGEWRQKEVENGQKIVMWLGEGGCWMEVRAFFLCWARHHPNGIEHTVPGEI